MTDRSVKVRLLAVTSQYTAAMAQAGQSTTKFARDAGAATGRTARSLQNVQTEATVAGGALLGLGIAAVAASTTFDKQMSAVQAASKASAQQLDALRESALQAGADTAFSATEAAQGQEELAKAGLSTADILGGALKGSLDLAAAGAVSVADASEIAATALKVFGLRGGEVGHVADLLAAGAGKAQGGVNDLGMALKQSALVADQTGLSIEDTVGALAEFASAGLLGSDAGTSFKAMLQRLTPQSKEAATLMDQLGLRAYDASGQFIGLEAYAGKLRAQLGKLAPEQRNAAMQTLFGADAVRAASILYNDGAEGVAKWRNNVDDAGYAADQAATRLDNLAGDLEKLRGTIETDFIKSGSSVNGVLRFMTQRADEAAQAVGGIPGPVLGTGVAAATAAGAFLLLAPRIVASADAYALMAARAPRATAAIAASAKAAGVTTVALIGLSYATDRFRDAVGNVPVEGKQAAATLEQVGRSAGFTKDVMNDLGASNLSLADGLHAVFDRSIIENVNGFATSVSSLNGVLPWGDDDDVQRARRFFESTDAGLSALVAGGKTDAAAKAFDQITQAAAAQGIDVSRLAEVFPQYTMTIDSMGDAAGAAASDTGDLAGATTKAEEAAQTAEKAFQNLESALKALLGTQIGADEATANLEEAFDEVAKSVKENGKTLDLHTPKGRANSAVLRDIAKSALDAAGAYAQNGEDAATVERKTERARRKFVEAAQAMGASKTEAEALATKYGLIPKEVATAVTTYGMSTAQSQADVLAGKLNALRVPVGIHITVTRDGDPLARGTGGGPPPPPAKRKNTASGGKVSGPGTGRSDDVPMNLSNGEFVVNAAATARTQPLLEAINSGHVYTGAGTHSMGGGGTVIYQTQVTAAPGERAEETVPRAHRRQAFLDGMG